MTNDNYLRNEKCYSKIMSYILFATRVDEDDDDDDDDHDDEDDD